jgi:hypothetical protein
MSKAALSDVSTWAASGTSSMHISVCTLDTSNTAGAALPFKTALNRLLFNLSI